MRRTATWAACVATVCVLTACDRQSGILSPPLTLPPANYQCANNPMTPSGTFRIIYRPTVDALDTTPSMANRYLVPHRSADTLWDVDRNGNPVRLVLGHGGDSSTYCVTVFDSLLWHLPNPAGAVF